LSAAGRVVVASLVAALGSAGAAPAETGWTLWERPIDAATGQPRRDWQRRESFDAERWCRGAMTTAINQAFRAGSPGGRRDAKREVSEYQCLPEGADPQRAARQ
jgi:hypothetical protein